MYKSRLQIALFEDPRQNEKADAYRLTPVQNHEELWLATCPRSGSPLFKLHLLLWAEEKHGEENVAWLVRVEK